MSGETPRRRKTDSKAARRQRLLVRYLVVVSTLLLLVGIYNSEATARAVCNGQNEVRSELRGYLVDQRSLQTLALYRQFFPSSPISDLRDLRKDQIARLDKAIGALAPVNCGIL